MSEHTRVTLAIVGAVAGLVLLLIGSALVLLWMGRPGSDCLPFLGAAGTGIGGLLAYLSPAPEGGAGGDDASDKGV